MSEVETRAKTVQPQPDATGGQGAHDVPKIGTMAAPGDTPAGFSFATVMAGQLPELPPGPKPGTYDLSNVAGLTCPETPFQSPARFNDLIAKFNATDAEQGIGHVQTVVTGSSTIANWTDLQKNFAELGAINRGVGGSTLPDLSYALEDLVLKHTPDRVIVYSGTNDLAGGSSPEAVFDNFKKIEQAIHGTSPNGPQLPGASPNIKLYIIGAIPAPCREVLNDQFHLYDDTNDRIKKYADETPNTFYIDPSAAVDDKSGKLDATRFNDDKLHPKPSVYTDIAKIIKQDITKDEVPVP